MRMKLVQALLPFSKPTKFQKKRILYFDTTPNQMTNIARTKQQRYNLETKINDKNK